MDATCSGSACSLVKRRRVYPRQTLSITVAATSFSGTDSQPTGSDTSAVAGETSRASSGPTTSAPSAPTGRQDPSDSGSDGSTRSGSSNSDNSDASGDSSQPPSSNPPSSGPSSPPTSQPPSDPPSSKPSTSPPSSKPTSQPPSSDPTTPPSSKPTSPPPSSDPPSSSSSSISSVDPSSSSVDSSSSSAFDSFSSFAFVSNSSISPPPTSSGNFQTTITSAIATTVINGTTSTIFSSIPTTLTQSDKDNTSAIKRDIIAGSVGGVALLILVVALLLFYRRHQHKKLSFFKRLQPKPRTRLLDGEDMDEYDMGPATRYRDYPASVTSASSHTHSRSVTQGDASPTPRRSPLSREFLDASPGPSIMGTPMDPHRAGTPIALPPGAATPHLLGMRAETGSIFREAVWPPPGQPSTLVDPLVNASNSVDLSSIVDDVMGPNGPGTTGHAPPPAFRLAGASERGSSGSLIGDDPFASLTTLATVTPAHSQNGSGSPPGHSRETSDAPLLPRFKTLSESAPPPTYASYSTPGFFEAQPRRDVPDTPGSPMPAGKIGPLFVTNMGPLSPTSTISHGPVPGSPPPSAVEQALGQTTSPVTLPAGHSSPRNWLERSPKKPVRPSLDEGGGMDLADVVSAGEGHGVGEAI